MEKKHQHDQNNPFDNLHVDSEEQSHLFYTSKENSTTE
jgi:hypothetical protein